MAHKRNKDRAKVTRACGKASRQRKEAKESAKREAAEHQREADRVRAIERERRINLPAGDAEHLQVYKGAVKGVERSRIKKSTPEQRQRALESYAKANPPAERGERKVVQYMFPETQPMPADGSEIIENIEQRLGKETDKWSKGDWERVAWSLAAELERSVGLDAYLSDMEQRADEIRDLWERPKRAAKHKRHNPFLDFIAKIVADNPSISAKEVRLILKALPADAKIILRNYNAKNDSLEWSRPGKNNWHVEFLGGLNDRVSRARKKLKVKQLPT